MASRILGLGDIETLLEKAQVTNIPILLIYSTYFIIDGSRYRSSIKNC